MIARFAKTFGWLLEYLLIALMVALTAVVVVGVVYRKILGASLSWYDEIAAILLIWITFYGAALAALRRKHIGFDGFLVVLPLPLRTAAFIIAEILVIGFFCLLAFSGWLVFQVVEGENLISLRSVPMQAVQSVIPIASVLFIIGELLSLPEAWRLMRQGISAEHADLIKEGILPPGHDSLSSGADKTGTRP